jgi:hypothetical protein
MFKVQAEYYDTLGSGSIREGNCCWCKRVEFEIPENSTKRSVVMRAKKELGLTGLVCDRYSYGGSIVLHPRNSCTAISIVEYAQN